MLRLWENALLISFMLQYFRPDALYIHILNRLSYHTSNKVEIKMHCVVLQHGSGEGGADSAGRGSDSGCEFSCSYWGCTQCDNETLTWANVFLVNVLFFPTGHKPEGGKEQPSPAFSVQRGQAVEAAAGTVCQCVTLSEHRTKQREWVELDFSCEDFFFWHKEVVFSFCQLQWTFFLKMCESAKTVK